MPVDDDELDRLDLNHYKYTMVQNDQLFLAPIGDYPQNILDLGTGTGLWAIECADKYPSASVIGTDIAVIQPEYVPPNLTFQIDDALTPYGPVDGLSSLPYTPFPVATMIRFPRTAHTWRWPLRFKLSRS